MPLVYVAIAVVLLLVMMTKFKINGFIALFLVALLVGLLQGLGLTKTYDSIVLGVGDQLDELILILGFGAMLGKVLADSGAAQRIATSMVGFFGVSRVQLAMVLTAFAIGITMFYEVGFVLLIPLVFTIVREYKLPLLWVGLPMSIALSTMHSFLPPHPGPAAVAATFGASQGITLFYGLFIALPAAALIAFTWPRLSFIKKMNPQIPYALITKQEFEEEDMPSFGTCLFIVLIPVVLMGTSAVAELSMSENNALLPYLQFLGKAPVALLIALLLAVVLIGPKIGHMHTQALPKGKPVTGAEGTTPSHEGDAGSATGGTPAAPTSTAGPKQHVGTRSQNIGPGAMSTAELNTVSRWEAAMASCSEAVKPMAMIILVIGAGGAFKQVLVDSGIADYIVKLTDGWDISPIILAWGIAVLLRISLGSATVAVVTAAGIVLPLVQSSGASPELMVLAVSCGSIACSHVNDPGFWLFKEYLGLTVIEAIKVRTTYTSVLSLIGLGGVLLMSTVVG
jgi:Gnt-I system high-affinity gluconate transporter